jgi:hypothetical protein
MDSDPPSDQFDRIATEPHLTLRPEHEQKHADVLTQYLDVETKTPGE